MRKNIVAFDPEFGVVAIVCEVPDEGFDLVDACKKAATAYAKTEDGVRVCQDIGGFNWGDFIENVPLELCEEFGFRIVKDIVVRGDYIRDHGECLLLD